MSVVFWVVTPCCVVGGYQRFGGSYRLHLQGDLDNHLQDRTAAQPRKQQSVS
jgi:hypothetical protein